MILATIWYKIHNVKLLAIIEAFKIWQHYLEGCKHEVIILTSYNNFCPFMDIKSLSLARSIGPKSLANIILKQIIVKKKQTELQTLYLIFFSKIMK